MDKNKYNLDYFFDLLVRFYQLQFSTCPYDNYIVNSGHISLVRTDCGTTWAIRTIEFATPAWTKMYVPI